VFLKEEFRLTTSSYKIRGVASYFDSLNVLPPTIEVLSAGNLALAAAHECRRLGISCVAIVPAGVSELKKRNLESLGAKVVEKPFDEIWKLVFDFSLRECSDFLHPLNQQLLRGYGGIADEIEQQIPHCDGLLIPYGLGGLATGVIRGFERLGGLVPVYICEVEGHDPFNRSLKHGNFTRGRKLQSFIEAMGTPEVVPDIYASICERIAGVITVTEPEVRVAIRLLHERCAIRAEGAAGAAMAAAIKLKRQGKHAPVAVLTGGNISEQDFREILTAL
jgi:threonine dehydratase